MKLVVEAVLLGRPNLAIALVQETGTFAQNPLAHSKKYLVGYFLYPGPYNTFPGRAPVCFPWSTTTCPFTTT